jgi:hypothetical protein
LGHHPLGLWCHNREYFAYIDTQKKEWDFTEEADLVNRQSEDNDERVVRMEKIELVERVWDFFPRTNKAHFIVNCLVKYSDIVVVDDKGDVLYHFPHIYVDFTGAKGPFAGWSNFFKLGEREILLTDEYKRIKVFPDKFPETRFGKIYKDKPIILDPKTLEDFKEYRVETLYESDGRYSFLTSKDVIPVANIGKESEEVFIQITYKLRARIKDYLTQIGETFVARRSIGQQLGREFDDNEEINIYEFKRVYQWQLQKSNNT